MNLKLKVALLLVAAAGFAAAQVPSVNAGGILNSASYALDGLPNSGVAQGSIFVIYGANMGPAAGQFGSVPLKTDPVAGTQVNVTSGGAATPVLLIYVSAGFIQAVLPSTVAAGPATLTVKTAAGTSTPVPFTVVRSGFGLYTLNQAGSGPAVLTNPSYTVNTLTAAMEPGSFITIWGTGLGPATGGDEARGTGTLDPGIASQVEVWVGNQKASVQYAGRGGGFAGLDQINFVIPAGVQGCYLPLFVKVGNAVSNFASISVSAAGQKTCSDAYSYSAADLQKAQTAGALKVGAISLSRIGFSMTLPVLGKFELKNDSANATFESLAYTSLLGSQGTYGLSSLGSCVVHTFKDTNAGFVDPVQATPLDAGPSLQLTGPSGNKTIDLKSKGIYNSSFTAQGLPNPLDPGYLVPGHYTITGTGGADVGPFTAALDIPERLVWTNQDAITDVPRTSPLTVNWTGGGATDAVIIIGTSASATPVAGATFICAEAASKGTFTVPAAVLGSLPVSPVSADGTASGMLMVGTIPSFTQAKFTATGIDLGYLLYTAMTAKNVNYK